MSAILTGFFAPNPPEALEVGSSSSSCSNNDHFPARLGCTPLSSHNTPLSRTNRLNSLRLVHSLSKTARESFLWSRISRKLRQARLPRAARRMALPTSDQVFPWLGCSVNVSATMTGIAVDISQPRLCWKPWTPSVSTPLYSLCPQMAIDNLRVTFTFEGTRRCEIDLLRLSKRLSLTTGSLRKGAAPSDETKGRRKLPARYA